MKKILAYVLSACMLFTSISFPVRAEENGETVTTVVTTGENERNGSTVSDGDAAESEETEGPEVVVETGEAVSRLEWLTELTTTFEMTVEEDNYPDNYYSDIDATHENYYEIMLATEFGLVDVEAGEALCPDDPTTREYAAYTLNLCLGYRLEEGAEYTFAEKDTVTYPNDIQVAINREWFALQDGAFLPDAAITVAEKDAMLADAKVIREAVKIDPNHINTFEFAEGVIALPEDIQVEYTAENEITLHSNTLELKAGDKIGFVQENIPEVKKIVSLEVKGEETICQVEAVPFEEAFSSLDIQGSEDVALTEVEAYDDNCANLKEVIIPNSVTLIEQCAFENCSSLLSVIIPDSVTDMETYIFAGCSSLQKAVLPQGRINITEGTFKNCTSLTEVFIPNTVVNIREYAFYNTGLTSITLPDNIELIEAMAFENCANLQSFTAGSGLRTIGDYALKNCPALSKVVLNEKLTSIGNEAFRYCDALTSITIPNSVNSLGTYIFEDCELLKEVKLGTGLTSIPAYAFNLCPSLEEIVIPYRVTTINNNAFSNCTALTKVTIPRATTTIGSNAFSYPTKMTIYGISGTYAETYANEVGAKFVNQEINATEVKLSAKTLSINKGQTATLVLTVAPEDFTDAVSWVSTDTSIATVSDAGIVTAKNVGTATIKVYVGDLSASCKVTVVQPVTSIYLNTYSLSMEALQTYTLTATAYPDNANNKKITWSSADESIATVDENGKVTAVSKGSTEITATAQDGSGVSRSCTVTVTCDAKVCTDVSQLESAHNYANNTTEIWYYTLKGAEKLAVTFDKKTNFEEDFDFLYVYDGQGNLVGKYTGTQLAGKTINVEGDSIKLKLVTNVGGTEWGFKVTKISEVKGKQVTKIALSKTSLSLLIGKTHTLTATVTPTDAYDKTVTWSSSNKKVATVDANGKVTAVAKGTATITATAKDGSGVKATCKVTVKQPVTKITLSKSTLSLKVKETDTLTATVSPSDANNKAVTWSSTNTKVATVDANGKVTAVAKGTATITATAQDGSGVKGTCKITVTGNSVEKPFPFTDVDPNSWQYAGINYVYQKGFMVGKSATTFVPNGKMTRAEFATAIYSMAGKPAVTYESKFPDVPDGQWFTSPVMWAYKNGIVSGYGSGKFGTWDDVTREQIVCMLYKYVTEVCGRTATGSEGALDGFVDKNKVSSYATTAMEWAVSNGIMSGKGNAADPSKYRLDPQGKATRAECAAMIMKLNEEFLNQ